MPGKTLLNDESESVPPSRATDVPSTLKDSGFGDNPNESSRNLSPEDEISNRQNPNLPGGSLLQTITDGIEEEEPYDLPEKPSVKMVDKPELISTQLPSDYIDTA